MKNKIVVIGGGGHAKVIISVLEKIDSYEIIGYSDILDKGPLLGIHYLGKDQELKNIFRLYGQCNAVLGIGSVNLSNHRRLKYEQIKELGFDFPTVVAKSAVLSKDVNLEEGTVVFNGAIINPSTSIGKCAIINSNATIEHDCKVGDFTHIASGVIVSGGVKIGNNCLIGAGCSIIQDVNITNDVLIGIGAVVTKNINEPGVYVGVPARRIK